jgi:hypothetical protein
MIAVLLLSRKRRAAYRLPQRDKRVPVLIVAWPAIS